VHKDQSGADVSTSSGIPYFCLSINEMSVLDLGEDPRVSMTVTLAQGTYCTERLLDPEDPLCAHVTLTGTMIQVILTLLQQIQQNIIK